MFALIRRLSHGKIGPVAASCHQARQRVAGLRVFTVEANGEGLGQPYEVSRRRSKNFFDAR